jgi:hypothetical protein
VAVFGVDSYGTAHYGTVVEVEYDVQPFTAVPVGYGKILLSWSPPAKQSNGFRLLRSTVGYPVRPDEGVLLVDNTTTGGGGYTDDNLVPGTLYYYALFYEDTSNNWGRAGTVSALAIQNHGSGQWLYSWVPRYYKYVNDDLLATSNSENTDLYGFLNVIGWGFDQIKTYYNSLLHLNDASTTSVENLQNLAAQLGIPFEYATSIANMRKYVRNWSYILREKGTEQGLRDMITAATGWDASVSIGRNMMLDEDQASFINPSYPEWDLQFSYSTGDRVVNGSYIYEALQKAYGSAQAPPTTPTNNTYWKNISNVSSTYMLNPATGNQGSWEALNATTLTDAGATATRIGVGVQSATDATVNYANALQLAYTGAASDLLLRSVSYLSGQSTMDAYQPILDGIPLFSGTTQYDPTVTYNPGDFAYYAGYTYQALTTTVGSTPGPGSAATSQWQCVGLNKRIRYGASAYASAMPGNSGVATIPFIEWYDKNGKLITRVFANSGTTVFDTFSYPWSALNGRTTPVGAKTWSTLTGAFTTFNGLDGCVAPSNVAVRSFSVVDLGSTTGDVYVTLKSSSTGTLKQALVMRVTDTNNYVKATRTQLVAVSTGTPTVLATYTTAASDNDRIHVNITGNVFTVYVNGVQVASATSTVSSTATKFGIAVE